MIAQRSSPLDQNQKEQNFPAVGPWLLLQLQALHDVIAFSVKEEAGKEGPPVSEPPTGQDTHTP